LLHQCNIVSLYKISIISMDNEKLNSPELQERFLRLETQELFDRYPNELIQFANNKILNYCFTKKLGSHDSPSARVLNNWIKTDIVQIDENDKGKIKRFDLLERIWINLVVEMREFGLPLEAILKARSILFKEFIAGLSLFKFQVLNTILNDNQTLVIYKDGDVRILASSSYAEVSNRGMFLPHLNFSLRQFIELEFPNNNLSESFGSTGLTHSLSKLKLLYFLKTGDFKSLKIEITEGDIRFIESSSSLVISEDIQKSIDRWTFKKITVLIDEETETVILPNN
jgi:hypothetical protein